jgi:DNA-binding NtrC family response regulator
LRTLGYTVLDRERPEDIPPLVCHCVREFSHRFGKGSTGFRQKQ